MATPGKDRPSFGEMLRDHRVAAGLSQEQVAERAGLSVRGVRYLEHDLRRPHRDTASRLVEALSLHGDDREHLLAAAGRRPRPAAPGGPPAAQPAPVPPTPLIGRDHEVRALADALAVQRVRVVTLTGVGGVGKTRLALEAATRLAPHFGDGVIWVPLAAVTDPSEVPAVIAHAAGVVDSGALPAGDALIAAMRERNALLLVDNVEQVSAAAEMLADLIAACPRLAVLATSRVALQIRAEHEIPVAALPVPDAEAEASVYALAANPSVDLFLRRAQAVRPGFVLTQANAPAVAAICRRLDGLPLALELAAARVRILTPHAMLEQLQHRLPFLHADVADLPPRQRTMAGVIRWSYDLLDPGQQALFRRLAVFEGGADLVAIEQVTAPPGHDYVDVLPDMEGLHRHSLVWLEDADEDHEPRLRMLETVREYARARLLQSGEQDWLGRRHADHYLALAEHTSRRYAAADTALARLDRDQDNLRAALRWYQEQEDWESGLRLAAALWWFWHARGHISEGRAQLAMLLPHSSAVPPAIRAHALLGAGQLAQAQGDYPAARLALQESLTLYQAAGDDSGTADAMLAAGFVARVQDDNSTATRLLSDALRLARARSNTFVTAAALHHLGMITADVHHDYPTAQRLLHESLTLYQTLGFPRFVALVLMASGDVALAEGRLAAARETLLRSLTGMRDAGERLALHGALDTLAHLDVEEGQHQRAVLLASAAARLREQNGTRSWPLVERRRDHWLGTARKALGDNAFHAAWTQGQDTTPDQAIELLLDD